MSRKPTNKSKQPMVKADAPARATMAADVNLGALSGAEANVIPLPHEEEAFDTAGPGGTMHTGLHDLHDADQHFDNDIHADAFPENWGSPSQLEAPEPRPGMKQRWVRASLLGKADGKNVTDQGRQGWRVRSLDSVPKDQRGQYQFTKDGRTGTTAIVNGDLVLCEMPIRLFNQMQEFYKQKRISQVSTVVDKPLAGAAIHGAERHGFGAPHVEERRTHVTIDRVPIVAADR